MLDTDILKDMNNTEELGKRKMNEFIQDRLIGGKVCFFEPIKKNYLKTGIKKEKNLAGRLSSIWLNC